MGQHCGQQSQAGARKHADSGGLLGGPETDPAGLGTSVSEPSPSLPRKAVSQMALLGSRQAEQGAREAAPVRVSARPEEGEEASACLCSQQLEGLPPTKRHGLPEPSPAALHHLAEVLISK